MKNYPPVNAGLQIVPLRTQAPYPFIDEVIGLIDRSGFSYEVGPFSTSIEANLEDITRLMQDIRNLLFDKGLDEFLLNLQIQFNQKDAVSAKAKTEKFKK